MLVLSRRLGEKIRIGDDIIVTVLELKWREVLIGVEAPLTVPVHRQEIYERIQAEAAAIERKNKPRKKGKAPQFKARKTKATPDSSAS